MIILRSMPLTDEEVNHYRAILDRPRVKPGECEHPECTGVHSHSRPREEWCPRTVDQDRDWDNGLNRSTYKYLWGLRDNINKTAARIEELGGPSALTRREPRGSDYSGAQRPWIRAIVEGARGRRLDAVTTDAT